MLQSRSQADCVQPRDWLVAIACVLALRTLTKQVWFTTRGGRLPT